MTPHCSNFSPRSRRIPAFARTSTGTTTSRSPATESPKCSRHWAKASNSARWRTHSSPLTTPCTNWRCTRRPTPNTPTLTRGCASPQMPARVTPTFRCRRPLSSTKARVQPWSPLRSLLHRPLCKALRSVRSSRRSPPWFPTAQSSFMPLHLHRDRLRRAAAPNSVRAMPPT